MIRPHSGIPIPHEAARLFPHGSPTSPPSRIHPPNRRQGNKKREVAVAGNLPQFHRTVSQILSRRSGASHLSKRPTRNLSAEAVRYGQHLRSLFGLAPERACRAAEACTSARWSLTPPFHPCPLGRSAFCCAFRRRFIEASLPGFPRDFPSCGVWTFLSPKRATRRAVEKEIGPTPCRGCARNSRKPPTRARAKRTGASPASG